MAAEVTHDDHISIQRSSEYVEVNLPLRNVCLRGVYVGNDIKDIDRCRGRVIESKIAVLFPLKNIIEHNEIIDFRSEESANKFLHFLSNFGYNAAVQYHRYDLEKNQSSDLQTFYRRSSFRVVNIGEWIPNLRDLSLSRLAIKCLMEIEANLITDNDEDKKIAEEECMFFFKMFGTHVYMANINIGGLFSVSTQTLEHGNALSKKDQVKDSKTETGDGREDGHVLMANNENAHRHFGGPQETCDFTEWKTELLKNPETWVISDMGEVSFQNCIGIWSFVEAHQQSFSNAKQLSCFIAQIWQDGVVQRKVSNLVSDCLWKTFLKNLEAKLCEFCSPSCHLKSLRELLQILEMHVIMIGKAGVNDVIDMFSEISVQRLFNESANHKIPINICFQILTTKLKILQIDSRKSPESGDTWVASNYFISGLLSEREFRNAEELLAVFESELLPGISALEAHSGINSQKVQFLAKEEIVNTAQNFLQSLICRQEYREALLLLVLFSSLGYHFKRRDILGNITFELLVEFMTSAKRKLTIAREYGNDETQEAWLLLEIIFKLDTNDASVVFAAEVNDFVSFLRERGFVFHSNIKIITYSEHSEPHGLIHSLAEICRFPCEVFDEEKKHNLHAMNPECFPDSVDSCALHRMIKTFGLEKFFPAKLSTDDVLMLSDGMSTSPKTLKDIPWTMFRHAIAMNYNFRENVLSDCFKTLKTRYLVNVKHPAKKSISTEYNPMDVFLALWHCCDPFLKKHLAAKVATCKLALPLIYENITTGHQLTLSLWPIRDMFIDDSPDSVLTKSLKTVSFLRIGNLKSVSKSKMINKFLWGQNIEHNTFYHRHCTLASNRRLFSNGIVEITWYVPRKENTDVLEELAQPVCILNMRGDAKDFRCQFLALLTLSDVVVVMSEFEHLNDEQSLEILNQIHSSSAFAIIMADFPEKHQEVENSDEDKDNEIGEEQVQDWEVNENNEDNGDGKKQDQEEDKDEKSYVSKQEFSGETLQRLYETKTGLNTLNTLFLSTSERGNALNESDLKDTLTIQITSALKLVKFPKSLQKKKNLLSTSVATDEDDTKSELGSILSETYLADVGYFAHLRHRKKIKDKIIPLQGEHLWHRWCLEQKQCFRSGKTSVSDNNHHTKLMKTLRLWQVMSCLENESAIVKFINVLERHIDDRQTITYFLQWMKYHMDCQSRQIIPKLSNDLFVAFRLFETLRSQKSVHKKEMENLKLEIKNAEEGLTSASFGLEHFLREMGQLYESFWYCDTEMKIHVSTNTKRVIDKMPHIAAKLLHWGHSLEIMDGDAASVPECWIKAVLNETSSIIGENKTLYVISILGIQSSGKSTLLNTMFGLQYSGSSGICTRGIYAQLIPVDKSKSNFKFDYALVLDTEGLKAPELTDEKYRHENELATLAIGLADVALINIKGETLGDMQDLLQIVIQAMIRLKKANEELDIKQSCVFVHQNVSSSNTRKAAFQVSQRVTSILDDMTKNIAELEKVANITQFADVISFNPVTNVIHVPDLWQGVPPMAPASPEYSKNVFQIAKSILGDICANKICFLNCQKTGLHLENLWKGILSEDFVFRFRNTLQVKAFTLLEEKFQNIVLHLEELKLQFLQNDIGQIDSCETPEKLQSTVTNIKFSFNEILHEKTSQCDKELQDFFCSDLSGYMVHWRLRKTEELRAISKQVATEIHTKIESERLKCEALFNSKSKLLSVKEIISSKAINFAKSAKTKVDIMSEAELRCKFEALWEEWFSEITSDVSQDAIQNKITEMKRQVEYETMNRFSFQKPLYKKISNIRYLSTKDFSKLKGCIKVEDIDVHDIAVHGINVEIASYPEKVKEYLARKKYFHKAKEILDIIFTEIEEYMGTQQCDVEYNFPQFCQVLKYVTDGFCKHNDHSDIHGFMVTTTLEIKTALMVQRYAINRFEQHIRRCQTSNNLRSKIANSKYEMESLFKGMYFQRADEEITTTIISKFIEHVLHEQMRRDLRIQIWSKVTYCFGKQKGPLMRAVLSDLAQKHEFKDYISYIENPKNYVASWIKNYSNIMFDKENEQGVSELQERIETSLERTCVAVQKCATDSKNSYMEKPWLDWVVCFQENLQKDFQLPSDSFLTLSQLTVENFENILTNIERQLSICRTSILVTCKDVRLTNMDFGVFNPFEEIMASLWGCDENCPWCSEPCIMKHPHDRHACIQHRPGGISGSRWTKSDKLACESCEFDVANDTTRKCGEWCKCDSKTDSSHSCKEYKKYMKDPWDIIGSLDESSSKYWNWVFREFKKDFALHHNAKLPDFPNSDAFNVTKEEAIHSLSVYI